MGSSLQSFSSSFRRSSEQTVVSSLGLLGSSGASGSRGPALAEADDESRPKAPFIQPRPSRKELWRWRHVTGNLDSQPGAQELARREVSPEMDDKCSQCLKDGHFKRDCTNDIVCLCGLEGHNSKGYKRPRNPLSEDDLRWQALAKLACREL